VRIKGYGIITMSAGGPTLTVDIKLGSTVIATAVLANATVTNVGFYVDTTLICRSTGASGTVQGDGRLERNGPAGGAVYLAPMYKAVTTVDTTASQAIDVYGTWSANTAGNAITITNLTIEYR
jgi:hypothetical protein